MYFHPLTYITDPPHVLFTDLQLCCYSYWLHELVPHWHVLSIATLNTVLVLSSALSSMNLTTMRLTFHPHGHSFNMHCITLASCYQSSMCIFNHHGVLVTIDMLYWQSTCVVNHDQHVCLSPPNSVLLHVMNYPNVMCFSPFTCVIDPPDVLSNHPHEPVELLMVLSTTNINYRQYCSLGTWVIDSVVHHVHCEHELSMVLSLQLCCPTTNMTSACVVDQYSIDTRRVCYCPTNYFTDLSHQTCVLDL